MLFGIKSSALRVENELSRRTSQLRDRVALSLSYGTPENEPTGLRGGLLVGRSAEAECDANV